MNKFKELAIKTFGRVNGTSTKKILIWSIAFLFMPFILSYLCEGLINLSALVSEFFAVNVGSWLVNTPLFSSANLKITYDVAAVLVWPIDHLINLMLSPFGSALGLAFFPLAAILGATLLLKTKGQSLAGLFVAAMGLVFSYAFFFMA
jgi:hypothetical protein